jgi:hypothetical protein
MTKDLYPSLIDTSKLQRAKDKMADAMDKVNSTIAHAEAKLMMHSPGIAVWIESPHALIPPDEDPRLDNMEQMGWQLGYIKIKGRWKLAVREVKLEDCDCWEQLSEPIPLDKASRRIRLDARYLFHALVQEIVAKADLMMTDIVMGASRVIPSSPEEEGYGPGWEQEARSAVAAALETCKWDFDGQVVTFNDEDDAGEVCQLDVGNPEAFLEHLAELASTAWYANVTFDGGSAVWDFDDSNVPYMLGKWTRHAHQMWPDFFELTTGGSSEQQ